MRSGIHTVQPAVAYLGTDLKPTVSINRCGIVDWYLAYVRHFCLIAPSLNKPLIGVPQRGESHGPSQRERNLKEKASTDFTKFLLIFL